MTLSRQNIRVFHYDDADLLCWAVSSHLERAGCWVTSGCPSVDDVLAEAPDVLLLEPRAAGGAGGSLLRTLIGREVSLPIVLLTTMEPKTARGRFGDCFDGIVQKPFRFPALEQAISQLTRPQRLWRAG